jgi:hypothetical protein
MGFLKAIYWNRKMVFREISRMSIGPQAFMRRDPQVDPESKTLHWLWDYINQYIHNTA